MDRNGQEIDELNPLMSGHLMADFIFDRQTGFRHPYHAHYCNGISLMHPVSVEISSITDDKNRGIFRQTDRNLFGFRSETPCLNCARNNSPVHIEKIGTSTRISIILETIPNYDTTSGWLATISIPIYNYELQMRPCLPVCHGHEGCLL